MFKQYQEIVKDDIAQLIYGQYLNCGSVESISIREPLFSTVI